MNPKALDMRTFAERFDKHDPAQDRIRNQLYVGAAQIELLTLALSELTHEVAGVTLMTDQPETCPKCGRRVEIVIDNVDNLHQLRQVVRCAPCSYTYVLEEETRKPKRKLAKARKGRA